MPRLKLNILQKIICLADTAVGEPQSSEGTLETETINFSS